jgi:uncharacterized RDD family membrane protein YckC
VSQAAGAVLGVRSPPTLAVPSATGVDASIVLAGPGARAMAFLVDFLLRTALAIMYMFVASLILLGNMSFNVGPDDTTTWALVGVLPATIIYFLYHVILEPLANRSRSAPASCPRARRRGRRGARSGPATAGSRPRP